MSQFLKEQLITLTQKTKELSPQKSLRLLSQIFPGRVVFSTSFSMEDQAISHLILDGDIPIELFTLDTGRLFSETYQVWNATNERYKIHISAYCPKHERVEKYLLENGPNAFYESVEKRQLCCHIRKVEPLRRALQGKAVWITGLRAEHSPGRKALESLEWDDVHQLFKYHPLLHWTTEEVSSVIRKFHVPYNLLHDRGFVSVGCAPCTRAVKPGESFRAGRWWWEDQSEKECGLHLKSQNISSKA